jgi:hypothetical protein
MGRKRIHFKNIEQQPQPIEFIEVKKYSDVVMRALYEWKANNTCSNSLELVTELKAFYKSKGKKLNTYCSGCMRECMKDFTNEYFSK